MIFINKINITTVDVWSDRAREMATEQNQELV